MSPQCRTGEIKDGEPFDPSKAADGLQELRTAYRTQGFVSFKSSVEPVVDESQCSIALQIKCDEGRQFSVDHINIEGLDEHLSEGTKEFLCETRRSLQRAACKSLAGEELAIDNT